MKESLAKIQEEGYKVKQYSKDYNDPSIVSSDGDGNLNFQLPIYGVEEYLLDRAAWQKQLYSITGEPGWFYFKIFFNFNSDYGLLGGILNDTTEEVDHFDFDYVDEWNEDLNDFIPSPKTTISKKRERTSINTAIKYLYSIKNRYKQEKISHRMLALYKFVGSLSYISCEAPWFFKGVSGLNTIKGAYLNDFNKDKNIIIQCSEDAVDMRLGTLLDLYKYACYDNINCKEIIPANLRKFDMSILVFHVPIKFHQTKIAVNNNEVDNLGFKSIPTNNEITSNNLSFSNSISFKLYSFMNCEIDSDSINGWIGDNLNNESAFTLGKNAIKINYDRVYEHRMNEWDQMMFGTDGFYYNINEPDDIFSPKGGINDNENSYKLNTPKINKFNDRTKFLSSITSINSLNEYSEHIISNFIKSQSEIEGNSKANSNFQPTTFGFENLNSPESVYQRDKLIDLKGNFSSLKPGSILANYANGNLYGTFTQVKSQYYKNKDKWFKEGTISSGNLYGYDLGRTGDFENRKNTEYLNKKLEQLKTGVGTPLDISTFGTKNEFKLEWSSQTAKNSYNTYKKDGLYDENKSWFRNLVDSVWGQTKASFGF